MAEIPSLEEMRCMEARDLRSLCYELRILDPPSPNEDKNYYVELILEYDKRTGRPLPTGDDDNGAVEEKYDGIDSDEKAPETKSHLPTTSVARAVPNEWQEKGALQLNAGSVANQAEIRPLPKPSKNDHYRSGGEKVAVGRKSSLETGIRIPNSTQIISESEIEERRHSTQRKQEEKEEELKTCMEQFVADPDCDVPMNGDMRELPESPEPQPYHGAPRKLDFDTYYVGTVQNGCGVVYSDEFHPNPYGRRPAPLVCSNSVFDDEIPERNENFQTCAGVPLMPSGKVAQNPKTGTDALKSCSTQPPVKNANREEVDPSEPPHGSTFGPVVADEECPSDERLSEEKYDMIRPNVQAESDEKGCEASMDSSGSQDAKEDSEACVARPAGPCRQIMASLRGGANILRSMRLTHRRPPVLSLPYDFAAKYFLHFLCMDLGNCQRMRVLRTPGRFLIHGFAGTVKQRRIVFFCNFRRELELYLKLFMAYRFGVRFVNNPGVIRYYEKCAHPFLMCLRHVSYHVYCPNRMGYLVKCTFKPFEKPSRFQCHLCLAWYLSAATVGYFVDERQTLLVCCYCAAIYARQQLGVAVGVVYSPTEQECLLRTTSHPFPNLVIVHWDVIHQLNALIERNLPKSWC